MSAVFNTLKNWLDVVHNQSEYSHKKLKPKRIETNLEWNKFRNVKELLFLLLSIKFIYIYIYIYIYILTPAWKVSKYGIFSGLYFPAFGLKTDISIFWLFWRSVKFHIFKIFNNSRKKFSRKFSAAINRNDILHENLPFTQVWNTFTTQWVNDNHLQISEMN